MRTKKLAKMWKLLVHHLCVQHIHHDIQILSAEIASVVYKAVRSQFSCDTWVVKSCKKWGFDGTFFINAPNFHHVAVK